MYDGYDDQLRALDMQIDAAEHQAKCATETAIFARWEFGRRIKSERDANGGKQLPNGRMAELVKLTGKSEREIRYRIQFADLHEESELGTLVQTFGTWEALRRSFTKASRGAQANNDSDVAVGREEDHDDEYVSQMTALLEQARAEILAERVRRVQAEREAEALREQVADQRSSGWAEALFCAVGPELANSVYRHLSKALHPDVGGSSELMRDLIAARPGAVAA